MNKIQPYLIPLAIIVAGGLVAAGIFFGGTKDTVAPVEQKEIAVRKVSSSDHILGNPNADVIMIEYSDIECPFCKRFHTTLHQAIDEFGKDGKVAWVYRHFPIDQLHKNARKEAEASECAFDQGGNDAFWKYLDAIYEKTPSNDKLDAVELPKIAETVGLDVAAFNECLSTGKMAAKVEADYKDAVAAGGRGTPYVVFVKDGKNIPMSQGAVPYATLKGMIEDLLK